MLEWVSHSYFPLNCSKCTLKPTVNDFQFLYWNKLWNIRLQWLFVSISTFSINGSENKNKVKNSQQIKIDHKK